MMPILVATQSDVIVIDGESGRTAHARGLADRPTCLSPDPLVIGRAWCGTQRGGVFRSDDGGESWRAVGLAELALTAVAASPSEPDVVLAGTEPSRIWRSPDGGAGWAEMRGLDALASSVEWSFPPKPHTHHVRWIACHPDSPGRMWVAIEAGALISTTDGGHTWRDRVPGGPYDTHELAIHREAPDVLRVAAGDGYFESHDAGETWQSPDAGLEVGYLRSVAIDSGENDVVIVSASTGPYTAYAAGRSDGRLYRREGTGRWERPQTGWPDRPATIAPLLAAGTTAGELWAADERGVHRSTDGGRNWERVAGFATSPQYLRGLAVVR